ncbi:integrase domain-containing protein [Arcobacter sp. 15-2]|uniref:tyrosine-type recombinase/integrase n=1 Tax=Arcobacter sp. 15-2 TaxID=3374109 RepID=UPI00399CF75E
MARTVTPLNNNKILNAKPKDKNYTLSDGQGLQLLIKPNGSKLWEFYYISHTTSKRRKTSFGTYPTVKLTNARTKRAEYQQLILNGIDPIDYFKGLKEQLKELEQNKSNTIEKVSNKFFELEQNNRRLKTETIILSKQRLENHFTNYLPKKEQTLITDISYTSTIKILEKLENVNKLETLARIKGIIIKIFKFAYTEDIIKDTEIFGKLELKTFKAKNEVRNNPTLTNEKDIQKIYNDILNYKNIIVKYLLIFTIHTAQRQGSIIKTKWADIDFKNKIWIISKDNMKMKKEHTLPLSDVMIKHLKEFKKLTGYGEYLFPNSQINATRNKYPHISNNTVTKALRVMGYTKEQQTAHGFRAMFKTVCKENQEEHNLKNEFVERVLAHKVDGTVEGAYNRSDSIEDMRIIVNWWSNYIVSLLKVDEVKNDLSS